jgi:hypothetical protein
MNLLVVGSDTRQGVRLQDRGRFGAVQGRRGDVIMLVHLDPAGHRAWMLSIPRDLYVPVAGTGGRAKINAALGQDPERLVQTVKADFGIPVSHYLMVDFDGFQAGLPLPLLRALAAQALGRGLTDPVRANAVLAAVASHLTRDDTLTVGQVLRLAGQFRAFRPGALVGLTIPTVPALRRNNVVLRPGLGSPTVLSWSGSSSHGGTRQLQCAGKGLGAARPGPG